jgi:hypothetical protein
VTLIIDLIDPFVYDDATAYSQRLHACHNIGAAQALSAQGPIME